VAELKGRYYNLPHLDVTEQPTIVNGTVNRVKKEVRLAVNENRVDDAGMKELINLLEHTLAHINHANVKQAARTRNTKAKQHKSLSLKGLG
jgi:hypothetical protein